MNTPTIPINDLRDFFSEVYVFAELGLSELADIVAPDAEFGRWTRFLEVVVPQYPHTFVLGDLAGNESNEWPADRSEVLRLAISDDGPWPSLHLHLPSVTVRVLISSGYVEIDLRRKTYDDDVYMQLGTLMHRTGDVLGVDVLLTPENALEEAFLAYDHRTRSFRKPLHGSGSQTQVRTQVLQAFHGVLRPFIGATRPLSDDLVRAVVDCIEGFSRTYGELALQDALQSEERIEINTAWGSAASIITPPAGVSARAQRPSCEQSLIDQARRIVPNERS